MNAILLSTAIALILLNLIITWLKKPRIDAGALAEALQPFENRLKGLEERFKAHEGTLKDELQRSRSEAQQSAKSDREEQRQALEKLQQQQSHFEQQRHEASRKDQGQLQQLLDSFSQRLNQSQQALNELLNNKLLSLAQTQSQAHKESREADKNNSQQLGQSLERFSQSLSQNLQELNELLNSKLLALSQQHSAFERQSATAQEKAAAAWQQSVQDFETRFNASLQSVQEALDKQLGSIRSDNSQQLDKIRETVDEKLQKTLHERLSHSFETVGKQLQSVQEGLGEMRNLATDVGGLKKVLSNVKMRGSLGEIQLEMLLEQILAPDQYAANVATKSGSSERVEFAIRLPGRDTAQGVVWLPIDAKFPKDVYEQLLDAYDQAEPAQIAAAQKNLEQTLKKMARDIREKYIDPPQTTDFGILFLPFEGIYAEVVRHASLLESLQRDFKIVVTGPTTLAAILNSLQMGFKTLAIEKRSSEVWEVLGAVKTEFEKFGGLLHKAHKNIQSGLNQLDDVMGTRTRAIERKLRDVQSLSLEESRQIFPELLAADSES